MKVLFAALLLTSALALLEIDNGIKTQKAPPMSDDNAEIIEYKPSEAALSSEPSVTIKTKSLAARKIPRKLPPKSKKRCAGLKKKSCARKRKSYSSDEESAGDEESTAEDESERDYKACSARLQARHRQKRLKEKANEESWQQLKKDFLSSPISKVKIYNVGQGNGILVTTAAAYWIIDFGSNGEPTLLSAAGSEKVSKENAIQNVKADLNEANALPIIIVVSHPDKDHFNMISSIFEGDAAISAVRIKAWIYANVYDWTDFKVNTQKLHDLGSQRLRVKITAADIKQQTADQSIFFLNDPGFGGFNANYNSLFMRLIIGGKKVLLTGDAPRETYDDAIAFAKSEGNSVIDAQWGNINYLVAPHHGAFTEDSYTIISETKPTSGVVFSCPMFSQFHHPTLSAIIAALDSVANLANAALRLDKPKYIYWDIGSQKEIETLGRNGVYNIEVNAVFLTLHKIASVTKFGSAVEERAVENYTANDLNVKTFYDELVKIGKEFLEYALAVVDLPVFMTGVDGDICISEKEIDGIRSFVMSHCASNGIKSINDYEDTLEPDVSKLIEFQQDNYMPPQDQADVLALYFPKTKLVRETIEKGR